jgi:hypothetical protein
MKIIKIVLIFCSSIAFSQEGYWDNQRITNKEIKLDAGERIIVKSEDFPEGTTEFVYRITLLDENQKMASDLASVLKAIPDPYFIGKGAGGAISLASAISGSDKCTYAIFSSNERALDFSKTANAKAACIYQNTPVSKDAKVVSVDKTICLVGNSQNIWFGFENKNWLLGEKIILEIVPWVDKMAARGWNKSHKDEFFALLKSNHIALNLKSSEKFCYGLLAKIQKDYSYKEFSSLSLVEQNFYIEKQERSTLIEIGLPTGYNEIIRYESEKLRQKKNYEEAIKTIENKLVNASIAIALDYNLLAELYIYTKQFEKSFKSLKNAEKLDASELLVQLNLAHTYMFLDKMSECKSIHKRFKDQNVTSKMNWKSKAIADLKAFENVDLPQTNIKKILRLLE